MLRSSEFCKRYEYVSYDLQTPITAPGNNQFQKKDGYRFIVDSSGDDSVMDWYNSYLEISFHISKKDDNADFVAADKVATVNGAHSFIRQVRVKFNGINVLDTPNINQAVNVKDLVDFSQDYANKIGTAMFFYPDTNTGKAEHKKYISKVIKDHDDDNQTVIESVVANYNEGFSKRQKLLIDKSSNNVILPLNRYGFFESFEHEISPSGKVELEFVLEDDDNIIFRDGSTEGRYVVTEMTLWVPKMVLNTMGSKLFIEKYMKPHTWTYMKERLEISAVTNVSSGSFRISPSISQPRHVFVWFLASDVMNHQEKNSFIFSTFNIRNGKTVTSCILELSNGTFYPEIALNPKDEEARTFRTLLRYNKQLNYHLSGSLIDKTTFRNLYGLLYFDLTNQNEMMKSGSTKLEFRYQLDSAPNADYLIHALVLSEEKISVDVVNDKAFLRV